MLRIQDLSVSVHGKSVLNHLNLSIPKGEIHVVMGPNGAGKSTLSHLLMGRPNYLQEQGNIFLDGENLAHLETAERAKKGLFLAFQHPIAIPGLKISEFLRQMHFGMTGQQMSVAEFRKILKHELELLGMNRDLLQRSLNDGLSGGEMKRLEMLQLALLKPKLAILDEIDSGVDIDGQKALTKAIERASKEFGTSFLLITHYHKLLESLNPHKIHILMDGTIKQTGDLSLLKNLEESGYDWFKQQA